MGNQHSIGWVSLAALNPDEVITAWIDTAKEIFKQFTDEQLRINGESRDEHFKKDIRRYMRDAVNKRFLLYKTNSLFGLLVIQDKKEFVQIYGIAIKPYTILNLRTVALAFSQYIQQDYPNREFRGMVKIANERGKRLYRYLGATECTDWHDDDFDKHHIPLRISSVAAKLATEKNANVSDKQLTDMADKE
jgi:hypothetical protein